MGALYPNRDQKTPKGAYHICAAQGEGDERQCEVIGKFTSEEPARRNARSAAATLGGKAAVVLFGPDGKELAYAD